MRTSDITADTLLAEGFSNKIVEAIVALSRQENESYLEFIDRAASNELARPVKIADLRDNLDAVRMSPLAPEKVSKLKEKYAGALGRLNRLEPAADALSQSKGH